VAPGVLATTPGSWVAGTFISTTSAVNWAATANNYVAFTKVQLEEGTVATPFERRQYGQEFALCQRYYQQVTYGFTGSVTSAYNYQVSVMLPVTMRANPTVTYGSSYTLASFPAGSAIYGVIGPNWITAYRTANATSVVGSYIDSAICSAEL
jgi:hypothetical protein